MNQQTPSNRKPSRPRVAEGLLLNRIVLQPEKEHARDPASLGRRVEPFTAKSLHNGERIAGWHLPAERPQAPLALLCPANRGTKADALPHADALCRAGCASLMYDYQGFGDSGGLADVRNLLADAEGVLAWAESAGIVTAHSKIVLMGLSLGSLVAIGLAAKLQRRIAAAVLVGAVEPYRALRRSFGPLGAAVAEAAVAQVPPELASESQIQAVQCPVLFVHGQLDQVSTVEEARVLAEKADNATFWEIKDCDHLDIEAAYQNEYLDRLRAFLTSANVL